MIAIYARVSTEEQAKHGFSLMDQIRACKRKVGTTDVLEYIDEGISGEFLDRPKLSRLRQDVHDGLIHKVVCLDPDRLSRKLMNQLILSDEIESRAELVFVNGDYARTPEGQLFYQMRGAISQFEKAKINERMSRGRREKARQGRVLRDFHIYGYDFDSKSEQFVVNEREATIVRLVFDLFVNPMDGIRGINGIARYLTDIGVPTKRNVGVFHRQVVRQMLMNRAYIGEFYQNKWNTEGMLGNSFRPPDERIRQRQRPEDEWIRIPIPAIVEEEKFRIAQALLEQSRRRFAGTSKRTYLLSGLLRCVECGNTLTGRKRKAWGKEVFYYSDRKGTVGAKEAGCGLDIRCEMLEDMVWQKVLSWVGPPSHEIVNQIRHVSHPSLEKTELYHIDTELERLDIIAKRLLKFLAYPDVDDEDIRDKWTHVQTQKRELLKKREAIARIVEQREVSESKERAPRGREQLHDAWGELKRANVLSSDNIFTRDLLRAVVKEIRIHEGGKQIEIITF